MLPLYQYQVINDQEIEEFFEVEQKINEAPLTNHPLTKEPVKRTLTAASLSLHHSTQSEKKLLVRNDQVYQSDSYKSLRKNLRRFMGSLTKDQLDLVKITSKEMRRVDAERIQSRKAFNEKLSLILQREQGWEERLKNITHSDDLVAENYQSTYAFNTDLIQHLLVAILNSRNDKQDQKLRTQLARYKADINGLVN